MKRLVFCALPLLLAGQEWPQFRGPNGNGVAAGDAKPPVQFGLEQKVAWKTSLPPGHSSPVIAGDRIFLTAANIGKPKDSGLGKIVDEGGKLFTICLDRRTGKILWQSEVPRPRLERYQPTNSPASPSPVTDGRRVYVFFGDFGLLAYDFNGREVWRLPLGPFNNQNGHGSSPVLVDGNIVLLCDQDTDSYLLAVDAATGKVRWKTPRPEVTRSYSTPGVLRGDRTELIVPGAYQLASYDARSGAKLWWIGGLSWQPKSTPVIDGDTLYAHWWENGGESESTVVTPEFADLLSKFDTDKDGRLSPKEVASDTPLTRGFENNDLAGDGFLDERDWNAYRARRASKNSLLAVRPAGAKGDLTTSATHVLWRMQKYLPNVPSPLLYKGVLYLIKDGGILTAVDAKSGKMLKQGRLPGALDTYYASPVAANGHVYLISQPGKMTVLRAGPEWEPVASVDFADEAYATPAVVGNNLYVRTRGALYCFREP